MAERADAAERVVRGDMEGTEEARYTARRWFADQAAVRASLHDGDEYDRFVAQWIAERHGPAGTRPTKDLTDEELRAELAPF